MKIVSKRFHKKEPVYDIGFKECHNFILDNGAVASNCFNKAHSVSYSVLTYISAYLKANHPVEFFCSLMTVRSKTLQPKTWAQKAPQYIQEAKVLGVEINPPSINASEMDFFGSFLFSSIVLVGIKNIDKQLVTKPKKFVV